MSCKEKFKRGSSYENTKVLAQKLANHENHNILICKNKAGGYSLIPEKEHPQREIVELVQPMR